MALRPDFEDPILDRAAASLTSPKRNPPYAFLPRLRVVCPQQQQDDSRTYDRGNSTAPAMDEAVLMLQERGHRLDMLRIRAFPFHQDVADFIAEHEFVFLVEQNRDAQMRSLVVNECGIDPMKIMPILHYDGTPITARFIASAIGGSLDALKVAPLRVAS